jgi:hypothetical protein
VNQSLLLRAGAALAAAPGGAIGLSAQIEVRFASETADVGFLDIGSVGPAYTVAPSVLAVDVAFEGEPVNRAIVVARNLSNCGDWAARAALASDRAEVICEDRGAWGRALVLRVAGDVRTGSGPQWILIGLIGGCSIIFVIFVVLLVHHLIKRRKASDSEDDVLHAHLNL